MLLETTTDPRPDSALRVRWQPGTGKAKMVPTFDALGIELAWTGWRDVTAFTDYRAGSNEVLLLCRKTDELGDGADAADVVRPQRGNAGAALAACCGSSTRAGIILAGGLALGECSASRSRCRRSSGTS